MRTVLLVAGLSVVLIQQIQAAQQVQRGDSAAASDLWERVVQAKGGRQKLLQVQNLLTVMPNPRRPEDPISVELFVFPNQNWSWQDNRNSLIGLRLNVRTRLQTWMAVQDRMGRGVVPFPASDWIANWLFETHARLLLETQWMAPRPIRAATGRIGREDFDIVVVDYRVPMVTKPVTEAYRAEYFVDRKTSLVRRVVIEGTTTVDFGAYRDVKGIMMPSRVAYVKPDFGSSSYEYDFNVAYDPDAFTRAPSIENGPYAWRPKGDQQPELLNERPKR